MRLIVQRVNSASVITSDSKVAGEINSGYLVLLGIKKGDKESEAKYLVDKLAKLRVMADEQGKMNKSLSEVGGEVLLVSQFTLYANSQGGNRPSFIDAEESPKAQKLYEYFVEKLKQKNIDVKTGKFGDYMKIEASLDGPVTIIIESK